MSDWSVPDWAGGAIPSPPPVHLYSPPNSLVRCELQSDPLWAKMSSAGVSNKKRKKSETKPQSQLTKSLNEKRRRELENVFIEELAELISASFADMSSLAVKPDKCAILQETVNQIRNIKEQEAAAATIDAVQQGEVSSSKQTILSTEVFGPLLLEALEGFLFVVNTEGKVEFVTENISSFIRYTREEVLGKSVYNILHHGDHGRFSSCLVPHWSTIEGSSSSSNSSLVATGGSSGPGGGSNSSLSLVPPSSGSNSTSSLSNPGSRNRTFNCRFLIKPPDDPDQTMEEKQQRVSKYENMQVVQMSSTQLAQIAAGSDKDEEGNDIGPCLMCVARRIMPNEKHAGTPIEQFSMKLDTQGKIIAIDTTGVSSIYLHFLNKDLLNRSLEELVHSGDLHKINNHMKETLSQGQATSSTYRVRISPHTSHQDKYIHVQTKSKLFTSQATSHEPDFIMATHSIIGETDITLSLGESSSSVNCPLIHHSGGTSSFGDPLIASVNGANSTPSHRSSSSSVSSSELPSTITLSNSTAFQSVNLNSTDLDFGFDMFPSSTWELGEERAWERPESRASLTPAPSPLAPAPATPFGPSAFTFSPPVLEDKESGDDNNSMVVAVGGSGSSSNPCRLRNLLTTKRESTDSDSGQDGNRNRHRILKGLLNQDEEEQLQLQQQHHSSHSGSTPDQSPHSKPHQNNMLLKLLSEKSDDDDVEARAGLKKQNELLQQLLKDDENNQESGSMNEDSLLKGLTFPRVSASPAESIGRGRKRPSSEEASGAGALGAQQGDELGPNAPKRPSNSLLDSVPPSAPVSSTGNSKLCQKNKMLASLLAIRPSTPTTIPPIPASVISATPQDKLPRLPKHNPPVSGWSGTTTQTNSSVQPHQQQSSVGSIVTASSGSIMVTARSGISVAGGQSISSPDYRWPGDESDPYLSHILDQVIEIVPDAIADSPALVNMINSMETPKQGSLSSPCQQDIINEKINETMAIDAIQKSLMQCETVVKTPVYNASQLNASQVGQQQPFPPPPMYQQRQRHPIPAQLRQAQYNINSQPQHVLLQHRNKLMQQQQQKQRLLQLQQQQHLLIPSNAAAASDPGIHNIDSLMNNTVAPNVSLQRSASVSESQLSPVANFSGSSTGSSNILTSASSQISPSQRQPYSPQPYSPANGGISSFPTSGGGSQNMSGGGGGGGSGGGPANNSGGSVQGPQQQSRLSPSSMQSFQQAQLSPRLSQGQNTYGASPVQTQASSWSQQTASRLSIQQQQNPMLNAQLTGGNYSSGGGRSYNPATPPGASGGGGGASSPASSGPPTSARGGLPPVRSLTSPTARQSPYPPELSPTTAAAAVAPTYQYRLQRSMSAGSGGGLSSGAGSSSQHPPQATTHLPGGGGGGPGGGIRMSTYKDQMSYHHYQHPLPPPHPHQQQHQQQHHHPPQPPPPPPPLPHHPSSSNSSSSLLSSPSGSSLIYPSQHLLREEAPYHLTPNTPNYNDGYRPHPPSGGNNGMTEYVKHELRAMVGARTGVGGGGGANVGLRAQQQQQQQQQVGLSPHSSLDSLGISFDLQTQGESPKMWSSLADMGAASPQSSPLTSRSGLDEVGRSSDQKSSLLQKLLSE